MRHQVEFSIRDLPLHLHTDTNKNTLLHKICKLILIQLGFCPWICTNSNDKAFARQIPSPERQFFFYIRIVKNSFHQKFNLKFVQFDRKRGIGRGNLPESQSNQSEISKKFSVQKAKTKCKRNVFSFVRAFILRSHLYQVVEMVHASVLSACFVHCLTFIDRSSYYPSIGGCVAKWLFAVFVINKVINL